MDNNSKNITAEKEKSSGFKTFLSVIFFILTLASALVLSLNLSMQNKDKAILDAYGTVLGGGVTDFLSGLLCFWCALSAVILWFGLWICTTKRIASAIRGLGLACAIAPAGVLIGELVSMLLVCAFKIDCALSPFADSLPSQFADTSGKNVIFLLSSAIIASVGILICKIKKMPKTIKAASQSEPNPAPVPQPVPAPAPVTASENIVPPMQHSVTDIDIDVSDKTAAPIQTEGTDSLVNSLIGVCHMCGHRNDANVKFCGKCGAKLV